ncbi:MULTISPECIES: hypothetical protein [unclassified Colwellia]|uniref:hypothetical protein n=1 Tax=unclassified Colwellia TaxID=196834 RepID=UPI0015F571EC|nr:MULTISPECIES: hypothetical protein [unclassified Colwellia]MBA6230732.1 hypothetical protein [Colwellia sp. MB02u-7]MBA6234663.1 hypothetical protein [Colwellia sp. MB02u-11]MBA6255526.1 hypothetical protein [Colwellia sp. MB3u-28]MBA6261666.1 hypothetical protein [Colwellia sp. MB3u-41]MBA6301217.1 hypothetical protein [Colwellia sp. MB3u-22]
MRRATLLCQQRQDDRFCPVASSNASGQSLTLQIDQHWLLNRPIVDTELFYEQAAIVTLGINLETSIDDNAAADF